VVKSIGIMRLIAALYHSVNVINLVSADETDDENDFRAYLEEEPEEVRNAWEELMMIQREQQRYSDIRSHFY
jgi:hypothetical protein